MEKIKPILKKNKRADFSSIIVMLVIVFTLAISAIVFSKVFTDVTDELKEQKDFSNRSVNTIDTVQDKSIPLLDFAVFFSIIAMFIGIIVASIYLDTHPVITVVFIIGLLVAIVLAGQFMNIFDEVTSKEQLQDTASNFTLTNAVMTDVSGVPVFPVLMLIIGIVVIVILYGKSKNPGGMEA